MRGLVFALIFFGSLTTVFSYPFNGILLWYWISIGNPHQLIYGFFEGLPYAMIVAIPTLLAWLISREPKAPPADATTITLSLLLIWISVTSIFALAPADDVYEKWLLSVKMFGMTIVSYTMLTNRWRLDALIWVIVLSLGYFGLRGGVSALMNGGAFLIRGPDNSMIADNNDIGVAFLMVLPLMFYLLHRQKQKYLRLGLLGLIGLTTIATFFTYSRGAFVAALFVGSMLWTKSSRKLLMVFPIVGAVAFAWYFAPPAWFARMATIETHTDGSSQGRLYYWKVSFAMAQKRPIVGGGFHWLLYPGVLKRELADEGLPDLSLSRAAHSIYFEMLGDHGFVGLGIFLSIIVVTWRNAGWVIRRTRRVKELVWANELGRMVHVSLVAYCVGGTFISFGMYDGFYALVIVAAAARRLVAQELRAASPVAAAEPWRRPLRLPADVSPVPR